MKKKINLLRYKELLRLEKEGKILPFEKDFIELLGYSATVTDQVCYNRKKDYFLLIQEYLSQIILPDDFRSTFLQMENEDSKKATEIKQDFQKLEVLTLAEDLDQFSCLIGEISTLCFEYNETWDGTMKRMSEKEFYDLVHNLYLQIQKAFPLENFNN